MIEGFVVSLSFSSVFVVRRAPAGVQGWTPAAGVVANVAVGRGVDNTAFELRSPIGCFTSVSSIINI